MRPLRKVRKDESNPPQTLSFRWSGILDYARLLRNVFGKRVLDCSQTRGREARDGLG